MAPTDLGSHNAHLHAGVQHGKLQGLEMTQPGSTGSTWVTFSAQPQRSLDIGELAQCPLMEDKCHTKSPTPTDTPHHRGPLFNSAVT